VPYVRRPRQGECAATRGDSRSAGGGAGAAGTGRGAPRPRPVDVRGRGGVAPFDDPPVAGAAGFMAAVGFAAGIASKSPWLSVESDPPPAKVAPANEKAPR